MSEVRKTYNATSPALDLQITELVNAVAGKGGKNLIITDPDTGVRYSLSVTIVAAVPTLVITPL